MWGIRSMDKKSYLVESIIYQILWVIIGTIFFAVTYILLEGVITRSIDPETELGTFYVFYFNVGKYIFMAIGGLLILSGMFIIQRKRFNKYNQYFESGLRYISGEDQSMIAFHESLSDEKMTFEKLHRHRVELEEKYELAYREKTDLLTYLAHDIKTPLANMSGYITLLNDEESLTDEQKRRFINVVYKNVKYLEYLSEEFFLYLKLSLNEIPLNLVNLNIGIFFRQWEEEKGSLVDRHKLILEIPKLEIPEINTDPQLLLRVMENLLSNAVKYSPMDSEIKIIVSAERECLRIYVKNIVEDNINVNWSMATSKFYRGDISRRANGNGSGLGLTIVNDIVKHLGGSFEIGEEDKCVCAEVSLLYNLR